MPIICWGNLAKSADDTKRIEQSISEYIEDHDFNPNAHQVEGSALYMHRIEEELDHALGSVDFRYLAKDKIMALSAFESLDGWSKIVDSSAGGMLCAFFRTSAVDNNEALLWFETLTSKFKLDMSKNPFFQTTVILSTASNINAFIGIGTEPGHYEGAGFGFKIVNGTEYAFWWDDNEIEHAIEISNIITTNLNVYRAFYNSDDDAIYFYVNGNLVYTATEDIPTVNNSFFFTYWMKNLTAASRYMYLIDFLFSQDR